jgi:hypothetical protein
MVPDEGSDWYKSDGGAKRLESLGSKNKGFAYKDLIDVSNKLIAQVKLSDAPDGVTKQGMHVFKVKNTVTATFNILCGLPVTSSVPSAPLEKSESAHILYNYIAMLKNRNTVYQCQKDQIHELSKSVPSRPKVSESGFSEEESNDWAKIEYSDVLSNIISLNSKLKEEGLRPADSEYSRFEHCISTNDKKIVDELGEVEFMTTIKLGKSASDRGSLF